MGSKLFVKLAFNNIRKDKNTFYPFLISIITMVSIFYMLTSVFINTQNGSFMGATTMASILMFGVIVTALLAIGIIFYTNSFLMKRRTKELGLYNILGMEKKHIGHVVFFEIVIMAVSGTALGLIIGIVFSKLIFLVLLKMLGVTGGSDFGFSVYAVYITLALFAFTFICDIIYNKIRIMMLKPVEMLQSTHKGEREPKAKWIMAVIGVICLGTGYYIAITTTNPIAAIEKFFIAVLFVIAGTYCLFISISVVVLKMLKKNKRYYYHRTHFITVSDMIYRMKQNAVGLANICIFSTAVLVVLSTTISLYKGLDDEIKMHYPRDIMFTMTCNDKTVDELESLKENIDKEIKLETADFDDIKVDNIRNYYWTEYVGEIQDNKMIRAVDYDTSANIKSIALMTQSDVNNVFGTKYKVSDGKVLLLKRDQDEFPDIADKVIIKKNSFDIQQQQIMKDDSLMGDGIYGCIILVVPDMDTLLSMKTKISESFGNVGQGLEYKYEFDINGTDAALKNFSNKYFKKMHFKDLSDGYSYDDAISGREAAVGLYSGLLFIGIFIGLLFIVATVLIIYYKQISEGYEDRENFIILQKVGLDKTEVRKIINNQMRTVFLLPIVVAVIHIIAAYNIISGMLYIFNLGDYTLYIKCIIATILVFFAFYASVYKLTSKVYYRIVNK